MSGAITKKVLSSNKDIGKNKDVHLTVNIYYIYIFTYIKYEFPINCLRWKSQANVMSCDKDFPTSSLYKGHLLMLEL